jgi:predicted DNA-binding protein
MKNQTIEIINVGPIRFPADLHARLQAAAKSDGRSIANMIRRIVLEYLDRPKTKPE